MSAKTSHRRLDNRSFADQLPLETLLKLVANQCGSSCWFVLQAPVLFIGRMCGDQRILSPHYIMRLSLRMRRLATIVTAYYAEINNVFMGKPRLAKIHLG